MIDNKLNTFNKRRDFLHFSFICVLIILLAITLFVRQILLVVYGTNEFASLLFAGLFIIAFMLGLWGSFVGKINTIELLGYAAIILLGIFIAFNDKIAEVKSTLAIVISVFVLSLFRKDGGAYNVEKYYATMMTIASICLLLTMLLGRNWNDGRLLYYTDNGNQSALLLMCYFLNIYIFRVNSKNKKRDFLYNILMIGLFLGIISTNSRTALIAILVLISLFLLGKLKIKALKRITYILLFVAFFLPFIISIIMTVIPKDFTLFGQTIYTGREIVWANVTKEILINPFKIHVGEIVPTTGMEYYGEGLNAHNVFLEISWRFSPFVAILFFTMFYKTIKYIIKMASELTIKTILPLLCSVFIHMTFEASLFVAALDYSLLIFLPIIILVSKDKVRKNEL